MALPSAGLGQLPSLNIPYQIPTYREEAPVWERALAAFLVNGAGTLAGHVAGNAFSRDYGEDFGVGNAGFLEKLGSGPRIGREQAMEHQRFTNDLLAQEAGSALNRDETLLKGNIDLENAAYERDLNANLGLQGAIMDTQGQNHQARLDTDQTILNNLLAEQRTAANEKFVAGQNEADRLAADRRALQGQVHDMGLEQLRQEGDASRNSLLDAQAAQVNQAVERMEQFMNGQNGGLSAEDAAAMDQVSREVNVTDGQVNAFLDEQGLGDEYGAEVRRIHDMQQEAAATRELIAIEDAVGRVSPELQERLRVKRLMGIDFTPELETARQMIANNNNQFLEQATLGMGGY